MPTSMRLINPDLVYIPDEIKRLEREVSDAEWNEDPRLAFLVNELNHYKELLNADKLYEPNF